MEEEDGIQYEDSIKRRRALRQVMKDNLKDIDNLKKHLDDVNSNKFDAMIKRVNEASEKSDHTRELSLDAIAMKELSLSLRNQALSMSDLSRRHDFDTLANRFVTLFKPENTNTIDWTVAGAKLGLLMNFCVSVNTMVGPLSKEEKIRKPAVRKAKEALDTTVQKPQEVSAEGADKDEATNERVLKLYDEANQLNEETHGKGFDLLKLLIDPVDSVQSVENLFDFSFLMKEKMVVVESGGGSAPLAVSTQPTVLDTKEKKQMVLSINMKDLEELATLLYGNVDNDVEIVHPLHRTDDVYKSNDAREQSEILEKKKKQRRT